MMKKFFSSLFVIIIIFLNHNNIFAKAAEIYTGNEILQNVQLQANDLCIIKYDRNGNFLKQVYLEDITIIRIILDEFMDKSFLPIYEPLTENEKYIITFSTDTDTYTYDSQKGFIIKNKESNKNIILRYILSNDDMKHIIENDNLQWDETFSDSHILSSEEIQELYKFNINENIYYKNDKAEIIDENPLVVPFVNEANRTMLPLRCIAEMFNYKVDWNEVNQEIILSMYHHEIILHINNSEFEIKTIMDKSITSSNSHPKEYAENYKLKMDTVPMIKHGRTFIPIRFISEILGYNVMWNNGEISICKNIHDTPLTTYPFIEKKDDGYIFGLRLFNSSMIPQVLGFSGTNRLQTNIYNENNELITFYSYASLTVITWEFCYHNSVKELHSFIEEKELYNTSELLYADICFDTWGEKDIHRIFFRHNSRS